MMINVEVALNYYNYIIREINRTGKQYSVINMYYKKNTDRK